MISEQSQPIAGFPASWWRLGIKVLAFGIAAVIVYLIFERYLRIAATILLLAAMLTYLLQPLVEWIVKVSRLKQRHAVRTAAVILIYLGLAAIVGVFGTISVRTLTREVTELRHTWASAPQHTPRQLVELYDWYKARVPTNIQAQVTSTVKHYTTEVNRNPSKYLSKLGAWVISLTKTAGAWFGLIIELIFVPIFAFYFLTDSRKVREHFLFFVPRRHREMVVRYAGGMDRILRRYVQSQLILCAVAWIVVTVALLILQVPGALLLGLVAGVSRAIPVVGPVVGGIPVLGAVLLTPQGGAAFWWVLGGFTLLHLFESKVLMPRILGDNLGVHPAIIILSLLIGYQMLGMLGMFVAPPVVAIVRFIMMLRRAEGPFAPARPPAPADLATMAPPEPKPQENLTKDVLAKDV